MFMVFHSIYQNILQGATSVDAYFPEGLWFSIEMIEEVHESKGEYRTISAPLDKIPIYLRGGHIIPWQEPDYTTFARYKTRV